MNIARNIRKARKAAKLTQTALAKRCDVRPGYISKLEAGKQSPSLRVLGLIARALRVKVAELTK